MKPLESFERPTSPCLKNTIRHKVDCTLDRRTGPHPAPNQLTSAAPVDGFPLEHYTRTSRAILAANSRSGFN